MIELILMASLTPMNPISINVEQFKPCVWPNTCGARAVEVAQFQPCVWPNKCAEKTVASLPIEPCVWPNKCAA